MRRSTGTNKTLSRDRRGIGCLVTKPGAKRSRDVPRDQNASETFNYTVLYYKRKNKVHKSKGVSKLDGTLTFVKSQGASSTPNSVTLRSEEGAVVYQGGMRGNSTGEFRPDETISVGSYDVEILSLDDNVSESKVVANQKSLASRGVLTQNRQRFGKNIGLGSGKQTRRGGLGAIRPLAGTARNPVSQASLAVRKKQKTSLVPSENLENTTVPSSPSVGTFLSSASLGPFALRKNTKAVLPGFKRPLVGTKPTSVGLSRAGSRSKLLPSKPKRKIGTANGEIQNIFPGAIGTLMVPHSIRKVLRPHQIEGVVFLWNCLTGNGQVGNLSPHLDTENENDEFDKIEVSGYDRKQGCSAPGKSGKLSSPKGCILSDEMGLGKTLMTIATISALHRQNRTNRFIVVCPASLVNNWAREFDKWLGKVGLPKRVVIKKGGEEGIRQLKTFCTIKPSNISEVLILSYDLFRMKAALLKNVQRVALLVVDEGHRLKNTSGSLTMTALESLPCGARLCITATPIQNNLGDMYTIVNFVCPGVLGDIATFRREYERPITAISSKRNTCTSDQMRRGEESRRTLDIILQSLMLRRLQKDILKKLLPPRHEFLLFCRPTLQQRNIYEKVSKLHDSQGSEGDGESPQDVLAALTKLRKICTHPKLLESAQIEKDPGAAALGSFDCEGSGKLVVLRDIILQMREKEPTDKVVIISNFTSTLTVIEEAILKQLKLNFLRLDGSINSADRQSLVDTFNRTSAETNFALTLSSKAGGVGLNLIGANRLIMVDPDWNPSTDIQAMARIYREGQKKSCFIYRCFTSGTLEEIILQRQIQKGSLATMTMDRAQKSNKTGERLNANEIRDCFTLKDESCTCDTRQKVANWPDYDGKPSLVSQGCQDRLLMEVSAKVDANGSMLSFVHIVKNDDAKEQEVQQDCCDRDTESESDEEYDCESNNQKKDCENGSSDEEFEFE